MTMLESILISCALVFGIFLVGDMLPEEIIDWFRIK